VSKRWQSKQVGEVLTPITRSEPLDQSMEYRLLGVRLDGGGPFHRETKLGAQIAASTLSRVQTDDFIYSRLFAWRGAFGVIGSDLDGCYVSGEFPTFRPVADKVDAEFLRLWFRLPSTIKAVEAKCSSSTPLTRNRFKEHYFLAMEICLPPLDEQRRIVARIEELAAKIEEARGLRREAADETDMLLASEEMRVWPNQTLEGASTLQQVTTYLSRGRQSEQGESEHYLIKTQHVQMGKYLRSKLKLAPLVAAQVRHEATVQEGDVLIACSAAGCLGRVARYESNGKVASTDTHVAIARPNHEVVLPEYLYAYLKGAQGQIQLRSREKGNWMREKVGFRLTELNVADMRRVPVPVPPLSEQRRIVDHLVAMQSKVDALKQLQAETAAELDALLPSVLDRAFSGAL